MGIPIRSEEEIQAIQEANLIKDGVYNFIVKNSSPGRSKASNNEMITLVLTIFTDNGAKYITDFLVDTPGAAYKNKHFCESIGLQVAELTANACRDQEGTVEIAIKKGESGYPPKNIVVDYIKNDKPALDKNNAVKFNEEVPAHTDDDIPF